MNYVIFLLLCDRMRFEVNCAKSHHRVISDGLLNSSHNNCHSNYTNRIFQINRLICNVSYGMHAMYYFVSLAIFTHQGAGHRGNKITVNVYILLNEK